MVTIWDYSFQFPICTCCYYILFGPPTALRSFGFAFGYMNLLGVLIQMAFPAAPPWYKNLHGLEPANYSMHGSPGGLGRIDKLLGVDMYTTGFSNSSIIFGAFPSLHSGCCIMEVLFCVGCFHDSSLCGYIRILALVEHDVFDPSLLCRFDWWSHAIFDCFEFTKYKYLPKQRRPFLSLVIH